MANTWRDWISKSENQQLAANLALGTMGAIGAKGDRDYARDVQKQNRGDSILEQQRSGYLGRANDLNALGQNQLENESRNAASITDVADPYKYKQELQRDVNRSMQLKKAAQMLGMPTSNLFNQMNTDDSILQRNANAVMGTEMNATDVVPNRGARNVGQMLGMSPLSSAVGGQNSQLANYVGGKNQGYQDMRQGMVNNTNSAYDKYDDSITKQIAAGGDKDFEIDPKTGELKKKTSTWRKILGGAVKYGVPIALAATGVGAPAAAAMMAGSSFGGDMIAGKGIKDAALGAAVSAIPGGALGGGTVGKAIGGKLAGGIASNVGKNVAQAAVTQGLNAASDYIPYVGAGLSVANGLPKAIGNSPMQAAMAPRNNFQMPNALTQQQNLFPNRKNPFANVRFG